MSSPSRYQDSARRGHGSSKATNSGRCDGGGGDDSGDDYDHGDGSAQHNASRTSLNSSFKMDGLQSELMRIYHTRAWLDYERKVAENEGRFMDADQIQLKLKQLSVMEAQRIEKRISAEVNRKSKQLDMRIALEKEAFESVWQQKLQEYDSQAKEILIQAIERQKWVAKVRISVVEKRLYEWERKWGHSAKSLTIPHSIGSHDLYSERNRPTAVTEPCQEAQV